MKKCLIILIAISFVSVGAAFAEKPDWVSEKNAAKKEMKAEKKKMKPSADDEQEGKAIKDEKVKGLEKQREKKTSQIQKESDKGSEKGQETRQKRKKWWKFVGGEE